MDSLNRNPAKCSVICEVPCFSLLSSNMKFEKSKSVPTNFKLDKYDPLSLNQVVLIWQRKKKESLLLPAYMFSTPLSKSLSHSF